MNFVFLQVGAYALGASLLFAAAIETVRDTRAIACHRAVAECASRTEIDRLDHETCVSVRRACE